MHAPQELSPPLSAPANQDGVFNGNPSVRTATAACDLDHKNIRSLPGLRLASRCEGPRCLLTVSRLRLRLLPAVTFGNK